MSTDFYTKDQDGTWKPTKTLLANTPAPRKRGRGGVIIGIVVAALVLGGGAFAGYHYLTGPADATLAAGQTYCSDIKQQNYAGAYGLLAPGVQVQESQAAFIASEKAIDNQGGTVTACTAKNAQIHGEEMTADLVITRQHAAKVTNHLSLALHSGSYTFTHLPDPAIAPFTATYNFCNELQSPNFGNSFADLSSHFQTSSGGVKQYLSDASGSINITGAIKGCHLQQAFLTKDGTGATIKFGIDFDHFINLPAQVTLVQDSASNWKVDAMQFTAAGQSLPFPLPLSTVQNVLDILKSICSLAPPNAVCTFVQLLP